MEMPLPEPSLLSLAAAALYLGVAGSAALAAIRAVACRQIGWHKVVWMLIAVLFVILAAMRVLTVEESLRGILRSYLGAQGAYEQRRSVQGPVTAAMLGFSLLVSWLWLRRMMRHARGRRDVATLVALIGGCAMIILVLLRVVSLHSLDQLLYGPLKLNWIADLGLACGVLFCAVRYLKILQFRAA